MQTGARASIGAGLTALSVLLSEWELSATPRFGLPLDSRHTLHFHKHGVGEGVREAMRPAVVLVGPRVSYA